MWRLLQISVALILWLLKAASASACPLCNTATGKLVREAVFNQHFGVNLLLVLVPFPVCLLIGACLYYGFPGRNSSSKSVRTD